MTIPPEEPGNGLSLNLNAQLTRLALLRKTALAGGLLVVPPALLAACGGSSSSSGESSTAASTEATTKTTVGLTTSIAGLGDQGFNDLAAKGVKDAESKLGVDGKVVEARAETDYVPDLTGFASDGYSLTYAVGFLMQDALKQVATDFPDAKFAIIDAVVDLPNIASNTFKEEEGSFLAGAFAAMMTMQTGIAKLGNTKKLGFIGGGDVPLIHKFQEGYEQGVAMIDPSIKVLVAYAGSFTDPAKGKELALGQYNSGADIVYQAAGPTGTGVIEAAKQLDRYVIGVDADQNNVAPDNVITSMQKKVDVAVFRTIESIVKGTFKAGTSVFGVKDGGIGLAPFHGLDGIVPADVKSKLADLTEQIKSGSLEIKVKAAA